MPFSAISQTSPATLSANAAASVAEVNALAAAASATQAAASALSSAGPIKYGWSKNTGTSAVQLVYGDIQGGELLGHTLDLTGSITAAQTVKMPSVAALVAGWAGAAIQVGQTFKLRIRNTGGSSSGIWTLAVDTGATWTAANSSTMTIIVGAWREWQLTFTSLVAGTIQDNGSGTI